MTLLISFPAECTALPAVWQAVRSLVPDARCQWLEGETLPRTTALAAEVGASFGPLSLRENQILNLLASNRAIKEIAVALHLSRHTVNNHTRNIYRKLGVGSRAGAIALLLRSEGRGVPAN